MNHQIRDHIKKAIKEGYSTHQIKEALLKQGYDLKEVEESLRTSESSSSRKKVLTVSLIIFILIIAGFGLSYYYPKLVANQSTDKTATNTEIIKVQDYIDRGWKLYDQQKFEEAITQFNNALASNPDVSLSSSARIGLGTSYYKLKDYEKATEEFNKALDISSSNDQAYSGLGWISLRQMQFDKSKTEFEKAISLNPNNEKAYSGLGIASLIMNDYDGSVSSFNKALAINESYASYAGRGWAYYYKNKFTEAIDNFNKATNLDPSFADPYTGLALSLYKSEKDVVKSEEYINKALGFQQIGWGDYYHIAYFYSLTGKNDKAREYVEKSLAINPTFKPSLDLKQKLSS